MNKGFILIEIIIAVILLSTIGVALLHTGDISQRSLDLSSKMEPLQPLYAIGMIHRSKMYHQTTKSLFDYIRDDYILNDDVITQKLKSIKLNYKQKELKQQNIGTENSPLTVTEYEISISIDEKTQKVVGFALQ